MQPPPDAASDWLLIVRVYLLTKIRCGGARTQTHEYFTRNGVGAVEPIASGLSLSPKRRNDQDGNRHNNCHRSANCVFHGQAVKSYECDSDKARRNSTMPASKIYAVTL